MADNELVHDGVLWADDGQSYVGTGGPIAAGPLCPADRSTLRYVSFEHGRHSDTVDIHDDLLVSGQRGALMCPGCGQEYLLGDTARRVGTSRDEAEAQFAGRRRRAKRK